jgi:hypothetical protein
MSLDKLEEGWGCVWGHREPRQRVCIDGGHILGRLNRDPYDRVAFDDQEAFEACDLDDPFPFEYDVRDQVGSELWLRWKRQQDAEERDNRLQAEYLSPIPNEVLTAVSCFANRHWHLLNLVSRCPGAFDLVRSTPALALALSSPWVFRKSRPRQPLRSARSLLVKHQADIAGWLGFPACWSTVKILRKLPPDECTVINLLHLRSLFGTHLKTLQHLPHLNGSIISLLSGETDRYQVCPRFLHEIALQSGMLDQLVRILRDTLWMRQKLEDKAIISLRSYEKLAQVHDRYVDQLGRMDLRIIDPPPFPPAPLPPSSPNLVLEPLLTESDLLEEGRIQSNCVGVYGSCVHRGRMYLYRLLSPERATLSIVLNKFGKWQLDEIKCFQNTEVLPETLSAVQEWVNCAGSELLHDNDRGMAGSIKLVGPPSDRNNTGVH